MNIESVSDRAVDALILTMEEAQQYDDDMRAAGVRLLFGAWYANPDKEQITDDFTRYIERRLSAEQLAQCHIGRAAIHGSTMVGLGLWLPPVAQG